jgi:hypothetical protein
MFMHEAWSATFQFPAPNSGPYMLYTMMIGEN